MRPLEVLYDRDPGSLALPERLLGLYGGCFSLPAPGLYANFVQSIDGIVAIRSVPSPGSAISGHSEADRFVMGLLRACADAVLVGAGTLRDTTGLWTAGSIYPPLAPSFADLRLRLGRSAEPKLVLVTGSGEVDTAHPAIQAGALILTTAKGARRLEPTLPPNCEAKVLSDSDGLDVLLALEAVRSAGFNVILSEAGPNLTGQLLTQGLVDELFVTVSPTLVGSDPGEACGLAGTARLFSPARPNDELVSVRRHGSHLFLRYSIQTRR